jgi:hypothetical protein
MSTLIKKLPKIRVFDASIAAAVTEIADTLTEQASEDVDLDSQLTSNEVDQILSDSNPLQGDSSIDEGLETNLESLYLTNELFIIDNDISTSNTALIIESIKGQNYFIIQANETIEDVAAKISSYQNLDAIHIISHGNEAQINLANTVINQSTLTENLAFTDSIKDSLTESGDLLLYGCNIAENNGQEFINAMAEITNSDVAASDDLTGNSELGGDWDLEYETGEVETDELVVDGFDDLLAVYNLSQGQNVSIRIHINGGNTFSVVSFNDQGFNGSLVVTDATGDYHTYRYTPHADDSGTITLAVNWKKSFGGKGGTRYDYGTHTNTIVVTPLNDAPTAADIEITINEDTPLVFASNSFDGVFADGDGDSLAGIRITSGPTDGKLFLSGTEITTFPATLSRANLANLTFENDENENGNDYATFRYKVFDGTAYSAATYDYTVDVDAVNDAPIADNKELSVDEDSPLPLNSTMFNSVYSDIDGDPLGAVQIISAPSQGDIFLNGTKITGFPISLTPSQLDTLTFENVENENGEDYATLEFKVFDGEAYSGSSYTLTIDVDPVNDTPEVSSNSFSINEDDTYIFNITDFTKDYSDVEGDPFSSVRIDSLPTGELRLDGNLVSIGDVITITELNNDQLTYKALENENGNNYSSFLFSVSDGTDYSLTPSTMTIDVDPVNDAPVLRIGSPADTLIPGANETTLEDTVLTLNAADYAFDVDGDVLTVKSYIADYGTISDNGDGTFNFTPKLNFNGPTTAEITFEDPSGATVTLIVPFEVTPVNDAPLGGLQSKDGTAGLPIRFELSDFMDNYSDIEDDQLNAIYIESLPQNGTLSLLGKNISAGTFISKNDVSKLQFNSEGDIDTSFTFRVYDGEDYSDDAYRFSLHIEAPHVMEQAAKISHSSSSSYTFNELNERDPIAGVYDGEYGVERILYSYRTPSIEGLDMIEITDNRFKSKTDKILDLISEDFIHKDLLEPLISENSMLIEDRFAPTSTVVGEIIKETGQAITIEELVKVEKGKAEIK